MWSESHPWRAACDLFLLSFDMSAHLVVKIWKGLYGSGKMWMDENGKLTGFAKLSRRLHKSLNRRYI